MISLPDLAHSTHTSLRTADRKARWRTYQKKPRNLRGWCVRTGGQYVAISVGTNHFLQSTMSSALSTAATVRLFRQAKKSVCLCIPGMDWKFPCLKRTYAEWRRKIARLAKYRSTSYLARARSLRRCWTHSEMMFSAAVRTLQLWDVHAIGPGAGYCSLQ